MTLKKGQTVKLTDWNTITQFAGRTLFTIARESKSDMILIRPYGTRKRPKPVAVKYLEPVR